MKPIMETERLILREMEPSDVSALCAILRDEQTMYAYEGAFCQEEARACRGYAFDRLGAAEVFSIIRDSNLASMNVAIRNGMLARGRFTKHYRGVDMPHLIFSVKNTQGGTADEDA